MRSAIKVAYSMGSVAIILAGVVQAAPPAAFGKYTGAGGTITPEVCTPPARVCSTAPITGKGFMQREETIAGVKYIHTIIDDAAGFKSEDFVQFNSAGVVTPKGISSLSSVSETATGTKFSTSAEINTGWAVATKANASEAKLGFTLDVASATGQNNGFNTTFSADVVTLATPPAGASANRVDRLVVDQIVGLDVVGDKQHFYTALKPATTALTNFTFANGGRGAVTYTGGNPIQLVWVGQQVTGAGAFGTMSLSGPTSTSSVTDTTATGPTFPTQVSTEFFSTANPAPVF